MNQFHLNIHSFSNQFHWGVPRYRWHLHWLIDCITSAKLSAWPFCTVQKEQIPHIPITLQTSQFHSTSADPLHIAFKIITQNVNSTSTTSTSTTGRCSRGYVSRLSLSSPIFGCSVPFHGILTDYDMLQPRLSRSIWLVKPIPACIMQRQLS